MCGSCGVFLWSVLVEFTFLWSVLVVLTCMHVVVVVVFFPFVRVAQGATTGATSDVQSKRNIGRCQTRVAILCAFVFSWR